MADDLLNNYFAAISARENEFRGYANLGDSEKDRITPVVTLTRIARATGFGPALANVLEAVNGRPAIVDFDSEPKPEKSDADADAERNQKALKAAALGQPIRPQSKKQRVHYARQRAETRKFNQELYRVRSPDGGYAAWRLLAMSSPNLIPLAKLGDTTNALAFVDAVVAERRAVAFKVDIHDPASIRAFLSASKALTPTSQALLILDAGYLRDRYGAALPRMASAMEGIREALGAQRFDALVKISMSGSFPSTIRPGSSELRILERDLHRDLRARGWDVRYGDRASVFQRMTPIVARGWFPHVEVVHPDIWFLNRSDLKQDDGGYVEAARALAGTAKVWSGRASAWGTEMVERASKGVLTGKDGTKFTTPGPWIGARVSQHLAQQASIS